MLEQLLTADFLIFFAVVAAATGLVLWKISKATATTATPVEIISVSNRKIKPKPQSKTDLGEEPNKKIAELEDKLRTLEVALLLKPEDKKA